MTHARYWAATLATAVCGGFIVIVRFAFGSSSTPWIVFGVAIGATVLSLAGLLVALLRDSQAFSGLSSLNALIGAWTIIAMLTLNKPAAGWLAFADGLAMLIVSLRALASHETSIERVVYALEATMPGSAIEGSSLQAGSSAAQPVTSRVQSMRVSTSMRSWFSWLSNTGIAVAGAFIVVMTFALTRPGTSHVSPRWIAFGIAIAALCAAIGSLLELALPRKGRTDDWSLQGHAALLATGAGNAAAAIALIVTMIVYSGNTARWLAFALGCAMIGVSLVALAVHEITSERVRHELEIAEPMVRPSSPIKEVQAR